jgi:hypothetical protein
MKRKDVLRTLRALACRCGKDKEAARGWLVNSSQAVVGGSCRKSAITSTVTMWQVLSTQILCNEVAGISTPAFWNHRAYNDGTLERPATLSVLMYQMK